MVPETKTKGSLHVEIDSIKEGYSKVLVFVTDGVQVIMKSIYFEEEGLQIKDGSEIEVTHEGGTISLSYLSNVDCEVIIPEDVNWIHAISTKALEEKEMTFTVDPLQVGTRTAEIVVRSTTGSGYALTYKVIQKSDCYLELTSVETWYVELQAILPSGGKVVYMLADEKKTLTAPILAVTGINLQVQPNEIIRISKNVTPATHYYLYAMIKTDEGTWSDISEFEFTTKEAEYNGKLLSVVDTFYDGYHIGITAPHNGNAIRYSGMNKVQYNLLKNNYGDEFFMTPYILVANGGKFTLDNTAVIWDNSNIIEMDEYGNPVLDGNGNQIDIHDPITPGEPIVFLAGEFEWGTSNQMYDFFGWSFNEGGSGYYIPRFDRNTVDSSFDWGIVDRNDWYGSGWTGAFQKVVFTTKKPGVCDATVKIEIPEDEITSTGAMVYFDMDEEVSRYFYMVLDDAAYNEIIDVWFDMTGRPQTEIDETFQWFLTSWLAFYEWGTGPYTGDTQVNASAFFNNGWLAAGEEYHVLCTVMVDNNPGDGANQKYIHKTFKSKDFSKPAPVLEVTPVYEANGDDPAYTATFNIKVANKDVTGEVLGAYWACQASRDFEKAFDSGYTYESLLQGNYTLSSEEITQLNTPEGLTLSFPTLDGEVTRFAIYGANDEYNFNFIDPKTEGKGWADYRAPMASKVPQIDSPLYDKLAGDWTATATIRMNEEDGDGNIVARNITYSSKISIGRSISNMPVKVEEYVYDLYGNLSRSEVDAMYDELKGYADRFAEYRLEGQNRMLCMGFIDYDYYNRTASPYDLFVSREYESVDVPQLVYDFGPKWFLEVQKDGSVIVPMNSQYLPPMHAWFGYPFYVGGYGESSDGYAYAFYDGNDEIKGFPVEISSDYSRITIKPIVWEGVSYYMNALGINPISGSVEIAVPVISEIVLTKGWIETRTMGATDCAPVPAEVKAVTIDGRPVTIPEKRIYKSMTELRTEPRKEYRVDDTPNVVTMEMVNATTEKILRRFDW